MTVRNTKRLVMVAAALATSALATSALAANLFVVFLHRGRSHDYFELVMPLIFLPVLSSMWTRLSKLEAEHGPDYVEPTPRHARPILIGLGVVALILGAVAAYLVATFR